jgi:arsenite-transporting ATPase
MVEPLLARLSTRFVLVVGKGGVGKTTTAGALALAFADRGQHVHLISTDPAHSIGDLFEQDPNTCNDLLALEEFDARRYADELFARVQPAFVTLIERGTYLDEADARAFLDLSMPGIDEVMAALRLVDLYRNGSERIVVDTAPTGHTLRLLESGAILRSWVGAGRAMAQKASVVAGTLLRREVRFPAEDVLDEIERAVAIFEHEVLRDGSFVVVTRSGRVVQAETERLIAELGRRGVRIAARITDRATSAMPPDVFVAPQLSEGTGCDALRDWAGQLGQHAAAPVANRPRTVTRGNAAETIVARANRLIWVVGKGGVGKSTCAAAIGSLLAASRRVCMVSTDPAGSLGEVFAQEVMREPTQIDRGLFARQIDATAELEEMRRQYRDSVERVFASLGLESAAQLDHRVVEALFDFAPPGIDEIISLVEILEHAGDYDVTIIDSAPTGHFLRLLELPEIALQWVHALLRLLLKYQSVASLDALGRDLLAFAKRLRRLKLDLSARDTTAVYVVTLAEPLVIAETQRLCAALERAQIPIAAIVLNRTDEGRAHAMRSEFSPNQVMLAPDAGGEVIGSPALHAFLMQWVQVGD